MMMEKLQQFSRSVSEHLTSVLIVILINAQQGSVFVEFKEESSAAKFIEAEELKYKDSVLLREFKYVFYLVCSLS